MDAEGERRVCAKSSGDGIDRLSNLLESLKFEILLKLPTKDVVKTSVLSKKWRYMWPLVPGLYLKNGDFPDCNAFVTFVDRFLGFNRSCVQIFKLKSQHGLKYEWEWDQPDVSHVIWWIDNVLKRNVQHLLLLDTDWMGSELVMPPSIYTCASLVSLKLKSLILPNPEVVSLPCVKSIYLEWVTFANSWAFEMFISGCPVLESLHIERSHSDHVKVLRVCSKSLLSFRIADDFPEPEETHLTVAIDAPKLENLELYDEETDSFVVSNLESLTKVGIRITFNLSSEKKFDPDDLPKRNMIRKFLIGISKVKEMTIDSDTLEVIYNYSICEPLPVFPYLSCMDADFNDYRWEMLPNFLESCSNLKSLSLVFTKSRSKEEGVNILPGPRRFLTTLEYVKIIQPMVDETADRNLVTYLLMNSTILKEFTYCLVDCDSRKKDKNELDAILKKLLAIPRLSSSCQISVL